VLSIASTLVLACLGLSGAAVDAGRQALGAGLAWRDWRPGRPPPPTLFGVHTFEPSGVPESDRARELALRTLAWLGIRPDAPPAGVRLAYRVEGAEGPALELLARVGRALGAEAEAPAEISGWVLSAGALRLRLASGPERMRLSLRAGRVRLRAGGEQVEPGVEDVRFAGRRARNFHPGVWLALALRPGGRLRLAGPEPGRPPLVRLLAALPDGEAMEYVIDPAQGRLAAERAWAKTRAGMGLVTGWFGRFRAVDGVRVPWTWTSERGGRPVARGQVLRWAWIAEGDEHGRPEDNGP